MTDKPTASDPREVGRLAAFHYRDFRLFWISLFVSNIGTWMQMTATNWLLYQLTDSPVQLGLNGIFRAIPAIGFGLISGAFADRYDRRRLMLWTQLLWVCWLWASAYWTIPVTFKPGRSTHSPSSVPPSAPSMAPRARPCFLRWCRAPSSRMRWR